MSSVKKYYSTRFFYHNKRTIVIPSNKGLAKMSLHISFHFHSPIIPLTIYGQVYVGNYRFLHFLPNLLSLLQKNLIYSEGVVESRIYLTLFLEDFWRSEKNNANVSHCQGCA